MAVKLLTKAGWIDYPYHMSSCASFRKAYVRALNATEQTSFYFYGLPGDRAYGLKCDKKDLRGLPYMSINGVLREDLPTTLLCKGYEKIEPKRKQVYVAGSLRNDTLPELEQSINQNVPELRTFMEWYSAGPQADDYWKDFWQSKGVGYAEALKKPNSLNVFNFDKTHIDASDIMILVAPAGKSGHLELGYHLGKGKVGIYFFPDEQDIRWDVMLNFATAVCVGEEALFKELRKYK